MAKRKFIRSGDIRELATDSYNKGLISEKVYKAMLKFKIQENNLN